MLVLVKPVFKTFTFYLNTMLLIMEKRFFLSVSFFLCLFFFLNDTFFTGIESLLQSDQFLTCLYVALKKTD